MDLSTISTDVFFQTKNVIMIINRKHVGFSWFFIAEKYYGRSIRIKYGSRDELEREIERILKYTVDSFGMDLSLTVYFLEVFLGDMSEILP